MKHINKKAIVVVSLAVLLVLAGIINYQLNETDGNLTANATASAKPSKSVDAAQAGNEATTTSAFFTEFRAQRETQRKQELEYIDSVISNASTSKETLAEAQKQKLALASSMEKELTIEGLLSAKGFGNAVVTLHAGSVNVIVEQKDLTTAQIAQILDVVRRESGESIENIKIVPAN